MFAAQKYPLDTRTERTYVRYMFNDDEFGPCDCQSDSCLHEDETPYSRPGLIAEGMEALRKAGHLEAERLWDENGTVRS